MLFFFKRSNVLLARVFAQLLENKINSIAWYVLKQLFTSVLIDNDGYNCFHFGEKLFIALGIFFFLDENTAIIFTDRHATYEKASRT